MLKYNRVFTAVIILHVLVGVRIVTQQLGSFYRAPQYPMIVEESGETRAARPTDQGYEDFREYTATDGKINYGLMIEPVDPPPGVAIPYPRFYMALGGNGQVAAETRNLYREFAAQTGCGFFLPDYRGYGFNDGETTEDGIIADVTGAYDTLKAEGYFDEGVAVIGHSLGGAAAIALAHERPVERLIVVSSFTTGREIAKLRYQWPIHLLVGNPWPNADRLREIVEREEGPNRPQDIYIIHGRRDELVPFEMAKELAEIIGDRRVLISSYAGHNDIFNRRGDVVAELMRAGVPRR